MPEGNGSFRRKIPERYFFGLRCEMLLFGMGADFFKWKERAKEILHVPFCLVLFGAEDLCSLNHVSQGGFGFGPGTCF